jgi:competence protein ComEC
MNGIVFAAILIDRLRISMRICAIAAAVVLVLEPASLAGVSFQMSFGAVVALIAVYETWGGRLARLLQPWRVRPQGTGLLRRDRGDDGDRDDRHRAVLDLPFP